MFWITVVSIVLAILATFSDWELTLNDRPLTKTWERLIWGFVGFEIVVTLLVSIFVGIYHLI